MNWSLDLKVFSLYNSDCHEFILKSPKMFCFENCIALKKGNQNSKLYQEKRLKSRFYLGTFKNTYAVPKRVTGIVYLNILKNGRLVTAVYIQEKRKGPPIPTTTNCFLISILCCSYWKF